MARNDPVGSDGPRGKSNAQRKHREDGTSWTGTERYIRDNLMRQFMRTAEGEGGNSEAWRNSTVWCESCDKHLKSIGNLCEKCAGVQ